MNGTYPLLAVLTALAVARRKGGQNKTVTVQDIEKLPEQQIKKALGFPPVRTQIPPPPLGSLAKKLALSAGDARLSWQHHRSKAYQDKDLLTVAVREALQNSTDAILEAYKQGDLTPGEGEFSVSLDSGAGTMVFSDNGIGMSESRITTFTQMMGTEKGEDAAGGFGIAKAVIIGASKDFHFKVRSRNLRLEVRGFGHQATLEAQVPFYHQGTQITLYNVDFNEDRDPSGILGGWDTYGWSEKFRIRLLFSFTTVPFSLLLNGDKIDSFLRNGTFIRLTGSKSRAANPWETLFSRGRQTVKAQITSYPLRSLKTEYPKGAFIVRLNQAFMFLQPANQPIDKFVVWDLKTNIKPASNDYPLNAGREALKGKSRELFQAFVRRVEKEASDLESDFEAQEIIPADTLGMDSLLSGIDLEGLLAGLPGSALIAQTAEAQSNIVKIFGSARESRDDFAQLASNENRGRYSPKAKVKFEISAVEAISEVWIIDGESVPAGSLRLIPWFVLRSMVSGDRALLENQQDFAQASEYFARRTFQNFEITRLCLINILQHLEKLSFEAKFQGSPTDPQARDGQARIDMSYAPQILEDIRTNLEGIDLFSKNDTITALFQKGWKFVTAQHDQHGNDLGSWEPSRGETAQQQYPCKL